MTTIACRLAAVIAVIASPLAAAGTLVAGGGEGPSEASTTWHLLGLLAPSALWGLPLAYVVFSVVALLPRFPGPQDRLAEPRDATFVDRLTMTTDSTEGW